MYQDTLVRFSGRVAYNEDKYGSIVDDHTFPKQIVSLTPHRFVKKLECPRVIGTSRDLVGLYSREYNENGGRTDVVVIWNVSIRKAVAVFVPNVTDEGPLHTALGFGVCRETNDPKIVKITYTDLRRIENVTCNLPEVEVFTLSTGAWRRSYGNLPSHILIGGIIQNELVIDGVIYWNVVGKITIDGVFRGMLISFDMTSEEFGHVTLPHGLDRVYISKLGESLVVDGHDEHGPINLDCDVWMMGDGDPKSFTKLFTYRELPRNRELIFRKSGKLIIESQDQGDDDRCQLAVYEPYANHVDNLGIDGLWGTFKVCDYMETLLLLDQNDHIVDI
ncbi:uncharacterized protein LOC143592517 [Bidens hawaiensis]|uniref:uncharacterized protein LOC143592517 n=1 Tax=Bidens hawaiensis TaxID=980011 RepID=UPI0040494369